MTFCNPIQLFNLLVQEINRPLDFVVARDGEDVVRFYPLPLDTLVVISYAINVAEQFIGINSSPNSK
jgi:hypothetical protein